MQKRIGQLWHFYVSMYSATVLSEQIGYWAEHFNDAHREKLCVIQFSTRIHPVDTGHTLNLHKTFRRRPGRLLNVLCTFNLRPVSTRYWNNCLIASDFFHLFAQSIKLCTFLCHILKECKCWKWRIHQHGGTPFSMFYGKIWVGFCINTGKCFF